MMQFVDRIIRKMSWDSSVSVVAEQQGFRYPTRGRYFSVRHHIQSSFGLNQRDVERVPKVYSQV